MEESSVAIEALLNEEVRQCDLELFPTLPEVVQTASISGLLACCKVASQHRENEPYAVRFQEMVSQVTRKFIELSTVKGRRVHLIPWLDQIYAKAPPSTNYKHEQKKLSLEEALGIFDPMQTNVKLALERLAQREELFLQLKKADEEKDIPKLTMGLKDMGDAFATESRLAYAEHTPYWEEALSYADVSIMPPKSKRGRSSAFVRLKPLKLFFKRA